MQAVGTIWFITSRELCVRPFHYAAPCRWFVKMVLAAISNHCASCALKPMFRLRHTVKQGFELSKQGHEHSYQGSNPPCAGGCRHQEVQCATSSQAIWRFGSSMFRTPFFLLPCDYTVGVLHADRVESSSDKVYTAYPGQVNYYVCQLKWWVKILRCSLVYN